jgi:hypothetical protein
VSDKSPTGEIRQNFSPNLRKLRLISYVFWPYAMEGNIEWVEVVIGRLDKLVGSVGYTGRIDPGQSDRAWTFA